jgi:DNA-directed RNA polymerase subunit K/omega
MKPRIDSRSPVIDTEKCVRQVGDLRYDLVLIAAQRLRELKRQHREDNKYISAIDALLEVQGGQINHADYFAKVK